MPFKGLIWPHKTVTASKEIERRSSRTQYGKWKIKMFCHAPTVRRQTAGAGERCWFLQSLVTSRFDNAFVLDVIQGTVRDILSGRHHFSLIFMWPCHGPREDLGLLWAIGQGLQAFKVQLSLLCLRLLGPLNNFTSLFSLLFSHL